MKRNAMIRIILWSLALVILLGLMCAGLSVSLYKNNANTDMTYHNSAQVSGETAEHANIFSTPDLGGKIVCSLAADTPVQITRQENVDGQAWAYVVEPEEGWIPASMLKTPSQNITDLDIDWASGSITIEPGDVATIQATESASGDIQSPMVCRQEGSKLKISFNETSSSPTLVLNKGTKKDLTILVPQGTVLRSLDVDAASADLSVKNLTVRQVEIETASGEAFFDGCQVEELDLDTASGDLDFRGNLKVLECDSASASIYAELDNVPDHISIDTMSGDLELLLPENAGFTVGMDTMSKHFSSDFETRLENGRYVCADGACRIDVDAMSGKVTIRRK